MAVSFRTEDRAFVEIAIDECRRLGLEKYAPRALIWASKLPSDQCAMFREYLLIPEVMNGKLQPEESRPLIASAAIQRELLRRKAPVIRTFVLLWGALLVIVIGSIFAVFLIVNALRLGSPSGPVQSALGLSLTALLFAVGGLWRLRHTRRQRMKADLEAADQAGTDALLQVLTKIRDARVSSEPGKLRTLVSV